MIRASKNIMLVIVCLYFAAHSGYEQDIRTKQLYTYEFMHIHSYKRLILHATMHAYACLEKVATFFRSTALTLNMLSCMFCMHVRNVIFYDVLGRAYPI